jgi:hypothetical protein
MGRRPCSPRSMWRTRSAASSCPRTARRRLRRARAARPLPGVVQGRQQERRARYLALGPAAVAVGDVRLEVLDWLRQGEVARRLPSTSEDHDRGEGQGAPRGAITSSGSVSSAPPSSRSSRRPGPRAVARTRSRPSSSRCSLPWCVPSADRLHRPHRRRLRLTRAPARS